MTDFRPILRATLILCLAAAPGFAQEATTAPSDAAAEPETAGPADPDALSLGEVVEPSDAPGTTYVAAAFGEWEQRCVRAPEGAEDRCQLYQLLGDSEGNSVAEINIFGIEPGQQAVAGATIVTPLETLLTQQITVRVDQGTAKRYPFTWCGDIGCFARIGFTADEIAAFKRGNKATITIVPVAAPDRTVDLDLSLIGFTAGFDAVNAANGL